MIYLLDELPETEEIVDHFEKDGTRTHSETRMKVSSSKPASKGRDVRRKWADKQQIPTWILGLVVFLRPLLNNHMG